MCWYEIDIEPRDVLFFRDAKPMEASSVGEGARWPWPNTLHDGLMSAFYHKWPDRQKWEFAHKNLTDKDINSETSSMRFGGLKTVGVFPLKDGELCFPRPADLSNDGEEIASLRSRADLGGESNLPSFLQYALLNEKKADKESKGEWLTATEMQRYIAGEQNIRLTKTSDIYLSESRFGIGIDPNTGTADKGDGDEGGKLYIAEYLRLREGLKIKGFAVCESTSRHSDQATDVMGEFFNGSARENLVFGGQRGVASLEGLRAENPIPFSDLDCGGTRLIKWILLSPAIFAHGWRPGWVDDHGKVRLVAEKPARQPGQSRAEWRADFKGPIDARLLAARIDKPQPFSGWSLTQGGPRPTRLAAPAGSVYYFEAATEKDAQALVKALQGRCKSDYYGEKGFGFGLCAPASGNNKEGEQR